MLMWRCHRQVDGRVTRLWKFFFRPGVGTTDRLGIAIPIGDKLDQVIHVVSRPQVPALHWAWPFTITSDQRVGMATLVSDRLIQVAEGWQSLENRICCSACSCSQPCMCCNCTLLPVSAYSSRVLTSMADLQHARHVAGRRR